MPPRRRGSSRALLARAARVRHSRRLPIPTSHDRHPPHPALGHLLASLFLIWDAWNKHNGQPSLFGAAAARRRRPRPRAVRRRRRRRRRPAPTAAAARRRAPARGRRAAAAPRRAGGGEQVTVTTDLVKATLDSRGGTLVRLELLKQVDHVDERSKHVSLLDRIARAALYLARDRASCHRPAARACRTTTRAMTLAARRAHARRRPATSCR